MKKKFTCKSEAQKRAIRRSYAIKAKQSSKVALPSKFPFWARLKFAKHRTTLVIDEAPAWDKQKKKEVDGYVHREATHTPNKNYEEITPNPDVTDPQSLFLKRPAKTPKRLFEVHNKDLIMPEHLRLRYEINNRNKDDVDDIDK